MSTLRGRPGFTTADHRHQPVTARDFGLRDKFATAPEAAEITKFFRLHRENPAWLAFTAGTEPPKALAPQPGEGMHAAQIVRLDHVACRPPLR